MAWKLDNVDFSTYGITVLSASGLLDIPALEDDTHSWLDSNYSVAARTDTHTLSKLNKQIDLVCLIRSDSLQEHKYNLGAFYAALTASGTREVTHPYSDTPISVFIHNSIEIQKLSVSAEENQVGKFLLRLTQLGVPSDVPIDIYNQSTGTVRETLSARKDALVEENLMGDWFVSFTIESNVPLLIQQNDYIVIEGETYIHFHQIIFTKYSTNKYVYKLKFWHSTYVLTRIMVKDLDNFTEFYLNASTVSDVVDLIVDNMSQSWPVWAGLVILFATGDVVAKPAKNYHIQDENCLALLKRVCDEWDIEFTFRMNGGTFYIDVAERTNHPIEATSEFGGEVIEMKYGEGLGLYTLEAEVQNEEEHVTVLYAFGGSENLPFGYAGQKLKSTLNPLEDVSAIGKYGVIEKSKNFDTIYPKGVSTIDDYIFIAGEVVPSWDENVGGVIVTHAAYEKTKPLYIVTDSTIGFNLNDPAVWLEAPPKLVFNTGELAGYEFIVNRFDYETFAIYLTPILDEQNRVLPAATGMVPATGDEYVLTNINPPLIWTTNALSDLDAAAVAWLALNKDLRTNFKSKVAPAYIDTFEDNYGIPFSSVKIGSSLLLMDPDYAVNEEMYRIIKKTTHLYSGIVDLELALLTKAKAKGSLSTIKKQLDDVQRAVVKAKLTEVNTKRISDDSAYDLRSTIMNPTDGFIVPEIIGPETIDPIALSFDAGTPQFSIEGVLIDMDQEFFTDLMHVGSGRVISHNKHALDRRNIAILAENGKPYSPEYAWDVVEEDISLPDENTGYFVYAKVPLIET